MGNAQSALPATHGPAQPPKTLSQYSPRASILPPMRFLPALALLSLTTTGVFAADQPVSTIPWNRPEKWEGAGPLGNIPADYQLLYQQDFAKADALKDFVFTDESAWKWAEGDGKTAMELTKQSAYVPTVRSPFNIALLGGKQFGDFIVEAQCLQTGKEYGHRDMVFIFGFQGPSKFYYVHIATAQDDHANQIFIVNDQPRVKISKTANTGNKWGLGQWHKVRLERKASDGTVKVFFDDMSAPIMTADDKTFGPGWIGFGSFDDTGKVANIRVWGKDAVEKAAPAFPKTK